MSLVSGIEDRLRAAPGAGHPHFGALSLSGRTDRDERTITVTVGNGKATSINVTFTGRGTAKVQMSAVIQTLTQDVSRRILSRLMYSKSYQYLSESEKSSAHAEASAGVGGWFWHARAGAGWKKSSSNRRVQWTADSDTQFSSAFDEFRNSTKVNVTVNVTAEVDFGPGLPTSITLKWRELKIRLGEKNTITVHDSAMSGVSIEDDEGTERGEVTDIEVIDVTPGDALV